MGRWRRIRWPHRIHRLMIGRERLRRYWVRALIFRRRLRWWMRFWGNLMTRSWGGLGWCISMRCFITIGCFWNRFILWRESWRRLANLRLWTVSTRFLNRKRGKRSQPSNLLALISPPSESTRFWTTKESSEAPIQPTTSKTNRQCKNSRARFPNSYLIDFIFFHFYNLPSSTHNN